MALKSEDRGHRTKNKLIDFARKANTILDFRFWILDWELASSTGLCESICRFLFFNWYKPEIAEGKAMLIDYEQLENALHYLFLVLLYSFDIRPAVNGRMQN